MTIKGRALDVMNTLTMALTTMCAFGPISVLANGDAGGGDASGDAGCDLSGMTISDDGKISTQCEGGNMVKTGNNVLSKERTLISIVTAIAAGIMVIIFIIKAVQLARSGDNPGERSRAITALIVLFIAIALLGSISLFSGLAFTFFK